MAYVDIDPFGDQDKPDDCPDEPTGETIPLNPEGVILLGSDLIRDGKLYYRDKSTPLMNKRS